MHVNAPRPHRPLKEIQELGRLARTWQRLLPDEPRPAFEESQLKHIHRFLRHQPKPPRMKPLTVHNGLMHEHDPRTARIIERTLQNGLIPHEVLHSFRDGRVHRSPPPKVDPEPLPDYLPRVRVHTLHNTNHPEIRHFDGNTPYAQDRSPTHINTREE